MARGTRRQAVRPASERRTRSRGKERDVEPDPVPAVFRQLLEEDKQANEASDGGAPRKRRKVGETSNQASRKLEDLPELEVQDAQLQQTVILSSDESEEDWEDVDLGQDKEQVDIQADSGSLEIVLGGQEQKPQRRRRARKPATLAERRSRLEMHKVHFLCQLYHGFLRNHWCNDASLQKMLRDTRIIPSKAILKLHPEPDAIQIQRSRVFKEGLASILEAWRLNFRISGHGIQRPLWPGSAEESQQMFEVAKDSEMFADLADFRKHALDFEGSIDYSAQLFCALLRGFEVDARLVFSLQPLGFDARGAGQLPDEEDGIQRIHIDDDSGISEAVISDPITPQRISRLGRHNGGAARTPRTTPRRRRVPNPRHAIFWVEAFDEAYQKWIPIDPAVTGTMGKGSAFEPALNDPENVMTYTIAYENTGVAKDVTKRYTKAYIAKTRKFRVESTENGDRWLKRAMRPFRRRRPMDRDVIEDNMLLQREISEGMPKNVEDFKRHPVYVLERHLRRDEVIHPKRKVGQIAQRGGASSVVELVYRREDVHLVRSADKWFRMGRQIKMGEVPLKRVVRKRRNLDQDDLNELQGAGTETVALYASFQTELYVPDPVINGRVPRNGFRNLDVYVPSMIPPGGVHIKSPHAKAAAKIVGVDAVDAVTGFDFRGRHGTAKIDGVIIASEFKDAVIIVAKGLAREEREAKEKFMKKEELRKKKRLLTEKRIRARIQREYGGEDDESFVEDSESSEDEDGYNDEIDTPVEDYEDERVVVIQSTAKVPKLHTEKTNTQTLTANDEVELFGESQDKISYEEKPEPGGFILDDITEPMGGGFILDDTSEQVTDELVPKKAESILVDAPDSEHVERPKSGQEAETMSIDSPEKRQSSDSEQETFLQESKQVENNGDAPSPESMLSHDPEDDDADPDWLD